MIKLKEIFSHIKGVNKKLIIGCSICAVILVSGFGVYAMNTAGKEDTSSEQKVEEDTTAQTSSDENANPVQEQAKEEEKQPVEPPKVEQNKTSETANINNDATSNSQSQTTKNQQTEQPKPKSSEGTAKKENVQQKQTTNKPITYRSNGLGISFDMPASWANKYVVKDNGISIHVYMKNSGVNDGRGLLFTITSDITDYNNGSMLDSIPGVNKITAVNGKKYLLGAPTGCVVEPGDSDEALYKSMSKQISQVLKSLR